MVFAVDIGTTNLKGALIDSEGRVLKRGTKGMKISRTLTGVECDTAQWVEGFQDLLRDIGEELMSQVEAVVISGNGPTLVPVDSLGEPLSPAVMWMDNRATEEAKMIKEMTGTFVLPAFFLAKVFWFYLNERDIYKRTASFLSCPEYLVYKLTGEKITLLPSEGFKKFYWSEELLSHLGLDSSKMPPFVSWDGFHGCVNSTAFPGLKQGTPVICGGPDFLMSLLGVGAVEPGIICDRTGTSEGVNLCSDSPVVCEGLRSEPHVLPGLFNVSGLIPQSGSLLTSYAEEVGIQDLKEITGGPLHVLVHDLVQILNKMKAENLPLKELRITGGMASLDSLNRMKAEAVGLPVKIYSSDSDLVGNGVLGMTLLGYYKNFTEACRVMVKESSSLQ